jgi:hypothetical protein
MSQIEPTKVQLACNDIRALFFDPAHKGVIPKGMMEVALESPAWCKIYRKETLQKAWLHLQGDGYVYLKNNDAWIWGLPGSDIQEEHEKRYARMFHGKKIENIFTTYFIIPTNESQKLNYKHTFKGPLKEAKAFAEHMRNGLQNYLTQGSVGVTIQNLSGKEIAFLPSTGSTWETR